jgi:hypothetical protein
MQGRELLDNAWILNINPSSAVYSENGICICMATSGRRYAQMFVVLYELSPFNSAINESRQGWPRFIKLEYSIKCL